MESMLERVTLSTPGISCGHCVMTIEEEVGALPGVSRIAADVDSKRVDVTFDPSQITLDQIEKALAEAGYPVAN